MQLGKEKLPLLVLALASSIVTFVVQQHGGTVAGGSFTGGLANALASYVLYIGKMLWPVHLAAYYPYAPSLPGWLVGGCLFGLGSVTVLAIWKAKDVPYFVMGWLWYLGTLIPAIGFVQVGTQSMADRYTYVPMIGVCIIVAWGIPDALARWRPGLRERYGLPAVGFVMLICAICARAQVQTWQSSGTL